MKSVHHEILDALREAFEFPLGAVEVFIQGRSFDVKSIDVPLSFPDSLDQSDALISATLRDGRNLRFKLSALDGFLDGTAWD